MCFTHSPGELVNIKCPSGRLLRCYDKPAHLGRVLEAPVCVSVCFHFLLLPHVFSIGVGLISQAVFVSSVWELDSVTHKHLSLLFRVLFLI